MKLSEKIYRRITNALPESLAAKLDMADAKSWAGWGGAMNGQARRQQVIRDIFRAIDFDEVIETGTFRGATTEFLGYVSGKPVRSVEFMQRFYDFAKFRCAGQGNIEIEHGDSRAFLRKLADRPQDQRSFIYLDAHWQDDVPRHEELKIIHQRWQEVVVMIDDFLVPDDEGYGFAQYGGKPLTTDYLPPLPGWVMYFPSAKSSEETGSKRGSIVMAPQALAAELDKVPGLRRAQRPALDLPA